MTPIARLLSPRRRGALLIAMVAVAAPLAPRAQDAPAAASLATADHLFAEGDYDAARAAYQAAAVPGPTFARGAVGAVVSALRVGDFEGALSSATAFRRSQPQLPAIAAAHGDALWAAGLFDEADAAYADALSGDPREARALNGRGRLLASASRFDDALASVEAARALEPAEAEFHGTVGSILLRMHRYDAAAAAFRTYVDLLPERDRTGRSLWARETIRFLESFGRRRPFEVVGDAPDRSWTVPVRIDGQKVFVAGRINGARQEFVLDTGAEQTVISRDVARRSGVVPVTYIETAGVGGVGFRGLQIGRIDTLEIGRLKIRNIPGLIKNPPLRDLPYREPESFSPLALGLSMRLDYAKRELTMARQLPQPDGGVQLPLRMYRLATVRGTVNGRPAAFIVDTGGEVLSISGASAGRIRPDDPPVRRIPLRVYGTSGWDPTAFLMPNVSVAFSSIRLERVPVVVLDLQAPSLLLGYELGGIVGHRFLSRYRVTIDLPRGLLVLE